MPAVALATGLVIAVQSGTPGRTTSATGTTTSSAGPAAGKPPVETAAYVTKHVEAALANADHYIIRETTQSYPPGTYTSWTDPQTGSSYAVQGAGSAEVLSWNSTFFVNNVLHWRTTEADYSTHTWFVSIIHAAGPIQGAPPSGPDVPGGSPAQLREALRDGVMRVVGHGYINGHQGNLKAVLVFNDSWIARTPALVSIASHPQIPAGFTQVAPPK